MLAAEKRNQDGGEKTKSSNLKAKEERTLIERTRILAMEKSE